MKSLISKITTPKWLKARFASMLIFGFGAFFIVALTFNDIGNGRSSVALATGFGCGLGSVLNFGINLVLNYKLATTTSWLQPLLICLELLGMFLAVMAAVFGTIGYLEFH